MSGRGKRVAEFLHEEGPQYIPRVGDTFLMKNSGGVRELEVVLVEWSDEERELEVKLKPVITYTAEARGESTATFDKGGIVLQNENPYKKRKSNEPNVDDAIEES